jgi:hypothetical protein
LADPIPGDHCNTPGPHAAPRRPCAPPDDPRLTLRCAKSNRLVREGLPRREARAATGASLMPLQPDERKFTVVTCSLPVMAEALHLPHIELLNLCGDFDRDSESYSGPMTIGRSATSIPPRVPGCIEHQRARLNLRRRVVDDATKRAPNRGVREGGAPGRL